jgi:hypothetical protein
MSMAIDVMIVETLLIFWMKIDVFLHLLLLVLNLISTRISKNSSTSMKRI